MDGAKPIREIRLAAALVLEPRLLTPLLSTNREWRRLVGPEADLLPSNVAPFAARMDSAWGSAVRNHRGNGRLIEDIQNDTWAPGSGLEAIDTSGWPDGPAHFVLDALKHIDLQTVRKSLPSDIQQWVADAKAA